jgi:predicted MFS family arabinose efflux permease
MSLAAAPADRSTDPPWFTARFALLLVTQACFSLGWSFFFLLPKYFDRRFSLGATEIGALVAVASLGAMLSVPFVGYLLDRYERRRFVVLGSAMVMLAGLGYAQVDHVGALVVLLQLLQGVGFVLAWNAAASIAADLAPPRRMGRVIGIFGAANLSMNAVAPWIGERLARDIGWEAPFLACAGASVVAAILARRLPSRPRPPAAPSVAALGSAMRAPVLLRLFAAAAFFGVGFSATFTLHGPFALGQGVQEVAPFFAGFTALALASRILLGGVVDRFGAFRVTVTAMMAYAFAPLALVVLGPHHLFAAGAALGVCHGVLFPAVMALAVERAEEAHRGTVMTLVHGAFNGGAGLAGIALGAVADAFAYELAFVLAALVTFSGALLLLVDRGRARAPLAALGGAAALAPVAEVAVDPTRGSAGPGSSL